MNIFESALGREIDAVLYSTTPLPTYRWVAIIHANGQDYPTMKILNLDYDENPEENIAPSVTVNLVMMAGTYYKHILPSDSDLEITIKRYSVYSGISEIDFDQPIIEERYTATIFNKGDAAMTVNMAEAVDEALLNITDLVEVQFQLLNKAIEQLRFIPVGGVYRNCTAEDVLVTAIHTAYDNLTVTSDRTPIGVDIAHVSNKEVQESFVIPQGTRVMDLPDYIQNHSGGVFNSGMGSFIKDEYWYIYPKYDVTRFGNTQRTLTIIRVPPNKLPSSERTYRISGDSIIILATAEANKVNISEVEQLNKGNGVRFATADNFLESFVTTENNKTTAVRAERVNEFIGQERPTGIDIAPVTEDRITSNPYKHLSDITQRQGNIYSLVWENSDKDLILPGMLVKILVLEGEEIIEYPGVLLRAYHAISVKGIGALSKNYITRTVFNIFTDATIKEEELIT